MKFAYGANLKPGSGSSHLKYELHDVHRKWQKPGSLFHITKCFGTTTKQ